MPLENLKLSLEPLMTEYKLLSTELERLDALYAEVKAEKDSSKATARSSTVFLSQQNQVLNSVSTSRISVISKMSDIRRNIEELKIKEFNANKSLDSDGGADSALVKEMLSNIFSMKDADINQLISDQQVTTDEEAVSSNMEAAAALIDAYTEPTKEVEQEKEGMYETLRRVTDKELLEVVYDITSSSFLALSTAPGDEGSIVSDEYLQAHAPEVVEILSQIKVLNVDLENEVAVTDLKDFQLVEVA